MLKVQTQGDVDKTALRKQLKKKYQMPALKDWQSSL
jgi:hypothetical protein